MAGVIAGLSLHSAVDVLGHARADMRAARARGPRVRAIEAAGDD